MPADGLFRFIGLMTFTFAAMSLASQAFALEDRAWNVESHAGTVWVHQDAMQPIALNPRQSLRSGSTIETGDDGRVVLVRGDESIIVSPRTSIALPQQTDSGMATTILQSFGTILLQVEKRAKQHFEVETPFLAAVVKGTKFTVTVDQSGAAVHVVEGAVEVMDLDTGDVGMVRPGQTAHTPAAQGVGLSIGGPGAVAPSRAASPTRPSTVSPVPPSQQATASETSSAPVVLAALGPVRLDVGSTTNGLARAASVSNGKIAASSATDETLPESSQGAIAAGETSNNRQDATAGSSGKVPAGFSTSANATARVASSAPTDNTGGAGSSGVASAVVSVPPGLVNNPNSNAGGNGNGNGLAVGQVVAAPPGLVDNPSSNAGGNGNGLAAGQAGAVPPGLVDNPSSNAGGNGNGLAAGQAGAVPPGLVDNPSSNAGGNGNGLTVGQAVATPPGLVNNPNSNAGGNGNGNGKG